MSKLADLQLLVYSGPPTRCLVVLYGRSASMSRAAMLDAMTRHVAQDMTWARSPGACRITEYVSEVGAHFVLGFASCFIAAIVDHELGVAQDKYEGFRYIAVGDAADIDFKSEKVSESWRLLRTNDLTQLRPRRTPSHLNPTGEAPDVCGIGVISEDQSQIDAVFVPPGPLSTAWFDVTTVF